MIRRSLPLLAGVTFSLVFGWWLFPLFLYSSHDQPLQFSHAVHTGETVGLTCDACHAIDAEGTFAGIPSLSQCTSCHSDILGSSEAERLFVEDYVRKNREVPWRPYSRQPDNARFSHAVHLQGGSLSCESCHGDHGRSGQLRPVELNRLTGYSRDIQGWSGDGLPRGMKMDDCIDCHAQANRRSACLDCHK